MQWQWDDLRLVFALAECGGVTAAARQLGLSPAQVHRRLAHLQTQLGQPLCTPSGSLTPAGRKLLPAAQQMAEWAAAAAQNLKRQRDEPSGRVRMAAPAGLAFEWIAPLLAPLRLHHPALQIELRTGLAGLEHALGELDVVLCTAPPQDAQWAVVSHLRCPLRAYAAPSYAQQLPLKPSFTHIDWICWAPPFEQLFANQLLAARMPDFQPAFSADDFGLQLAAAQAGVGALILPKTHHHGPRHALQELDLDLGPEAHAELYLVAHKRQRHVSKLRVVLEWLARELDAARGA